MALPEILAALAEYIGEDEAKAKEVAQALREADDTPGAKLVAQRLLTIGAGKKKGETDQQSKLLKKDLETAQAKIEELGGELETAKGKPNEQQAAWDKDRDKLLKRAEKAEQERDAERTARKGDSVNLARAAFRSALKGRVDDFGLDALDRRFAERFKPREDGSGVDVLDEDGEPIDAPKGKTAEELLADVAFETVPAANRLRDMSPGGGSNRGGTGTVTVEQIQQEKTASGAYRL